MSLPTSYMTSFKNVEAIFRAIQGAKAPDRFTQKFLESLEFKSTADRLIVPVLKSLGFITGDGTPTQRYYSYLDQMQSGRVMAEAVQDAYSDLFQVNRKAQEMSKTEVQNKLKTLTQGKPSDLVLSNMANTFKKLASLADWSGPQKGEAATPRDAEHPGVSAPQEVIGGPGVPVKFDHLAYNIQIVLPESRDHAVYEAIFRSLKEHLLK